MKVREGRGILLSFDCIYLLNFKSSFPDSQDKSKVQRQSSQDKTSDSLNRSSSSLNRSDSNSSSNSNSRQSSSSSVVFPPTRGDASVRTRCREMVANSLTCSERPGKYLFVWNCSEKIVLNIYCNAC